MIVRVVGLLVDILYGLDVRERWCGEVEVGIGMDGC